MQYTALFTTLLAALTTAAPSPKNPTNFLLVTTTSRTSFANSSDLANVSATSLFDPNYQTNYLLRTIAPGYGSLPRFNLTGGTLETLGTGPHGIGEFEYNSTAVRAGEELQFAPSKEPAGRLGLRDGFLLSVGGMVSGWTICDGELEERVVCVPEFLGCVRELH